MKLITAIVLLATSLSIVSEAYGAPTDSITARNTMKQLQQLMLQDISEAAIEDNLAKNDRKPVSDKASMQYQIEDHMTPIAPEEGCFRLRVEIPMKILIVDFVFVANLCLKNDPDLEGTCFDITVEGENECPPDCPGLVPMEVPIPIGGQVIHASLILGPPIEGVADDQCMSLSISKGGQAKAAEDHNNVVCFHV